MLSSILKPFWNIYSLVLWVWFLSTDVSMEAPSQPAQRKRQRSNGNTEVQPQQPKNEKNVRKDVLEIGGKHWDLFRFYNMNYCRPKFYKIRPEIFTLLLVFSCCSLSKFENLTFLSFFIARTLDKLRQSRGIGSAVPRGCYQDLHTDTPNSSCDHCTKKLCPTCTSTCKVCSKTFCNICSVQK